MASSKEEYVSLASKCVKVDPSVTPGPLTGPIPGEVPIERTLKKPEAYKPQHNRP